MATTETNINNSYLKSQTVLQLTQGFSTTELEKAYKLAQNRLKHLTAKGPLQYYRDALLADAYNAYRQLKGFMMPEADNTISKPISKSIVARHAATLEINKIKNTGADSVLRRQQATPIIDHPGRKAKAEDAFCRDVIHRLEGDLIRFDSRRQLLQIADQLEIGTFRANFLMAQIVEAVRTNKLYITAKHKQAIKHKLYKWLIVGTTVLSALAGELWLINHLRK
ncbi:MAG: hypothetical protein JEZ07_00940 [Phycisphaerae bacterium]|nr:hypothetical protein [Phycisphaerae bacterium]